jgi:hypothetical protein
LASAIGPDYAVGEAKTSHMSIMHPPTTLKNLRALPWLVVAAAVAPACSAADQGGEVGEADLGEISQALTTPIAFDAFRSTVQPLRIASVKYTNKCARPRNDGIGIVLETCAITKPQTWFLVPAKGGGYLVVSGSDNGRLLNVTGASLDDGANIEVATGNWEPANEQWVPLAIIGTANILLKNKLSGKCLEFTDGFAVQKTCNEAKTEQQMVFSFRSYPFSVSANHSDQCINVANASTANHGVIQQYPCVGAGNERWSLVEKTIGNGITYFNIVSLNSGKCIDVPNASVASGVALQQYDCTNGANNQLWSVTAGATAGTFKFKSLNSGLCIGAAGGSSATNALFQQETCAAISSQEFRFSLHAEPWLKLELTSGSPRDTRLSRTDWEAEIAGANNVFAKWGLKFQYSYPRDFHDLTSSLLFKSICNVTSSGTCPDGSAGTSSECAARVAASNAGFITIFSRSSGQGCASDTDDYLFIANAFSPIICPTQTLPNTRMLGHELGHLFSLPHTFTPDALDDTPDDPGLSSCSGLTGQVSAELASNTMSYYDYPSYKITPLQAAVVRTQVFARFFGATQ